MSHVLVLGANGMLGTDVLAELRKRDHKAIPVGHAELDITDPESVAQIAAGGFGKLDAVINCAAYTAVDQAESEEQLATDVNGFGVSFLGSVCRDAGVGLYHVSTDFVFDGRSEKPYPEDAPTNPLGAYGRSKLYGERALEGNPIARVVRTAWLFGPTGRCFPRTMVDLYRAGRALRVVADQRGNPTYTPDLARVLVDLMEKDAFPGVYHAVGPETTSWHDFAVRAIRAATGETPDLPAITTEEYPTPAVRPKNSALADTKLAPLGIAPMRPLDEALKDWALRL